MLLLNLAFAHYPILQLIALHVYCSSGCWCQLTDPVKYPADDQCPLEQQPTVQVDQQPHKRRRINGSPAREDLPGKGQPQTTELAMAPSALQSAPPGPGLAEAGSGAEGEHQSASGSASEAAQPAFRDISACTWVPLPSSLRQVAAGHLTKQDFALPLSACASETPVLPAPPAPAPAVASQPSRRQTPSMQLEGRPMPALPAASAAPSSCRKPAGNTFKALAVSRAPADGEAGMLEVCHPMNPFLDAASLPMPSILLPQAAKPQQPSGALADGRCKLGTPSGRQGQAQPWAQRFFDGGGAFTPVPYSAWTSLPRPVSLPDLRLDVPSSSKLRESKFAGFRHMVACFSSTSLPNKLDAEDIEVQQSSLLKRLVPSHLMCWGMNFTLPQCCMCQNCLECLCSSMLTQSTGMLGHTTMLLDSRYALQYSPAFCPQWWVLVGISYCLGWTTGNIRESTHRCRAMLALDKVWVAYRQAQSAL